MVTFAALRLGFSNSVSQGFEEGVADDMGGSSWDTLDVKTFVLLRKLQVDPVSRRKAIKRFPFVPTGLVIEILRFQEGELLLSFKDVGVVTVKEVAVAPFSGKGLGRLEVMYDDLEGDFLQRNDFQYFLGDNPVGLLLYSLQIKPMEGILFGFPDRSKMYGDRRGIVDLSGIISLDGPVKLLDIVLTVLGFVLGDAVECQQEDGQKDENSFHGNGIRMTGSNLRWAARAIGAPHRWSGCPHRTHWRGYKRW